MDRAKIVAKVEDVVCWRNGQGIKGTLHLSVCTRVAALLMERYSAGFLSHMWCCSQDTDMD